MKNKNKKIGIMAVFIVVIIVLVYLCYTHYDGKNTDDTNNDIPENFNSVSKPLDDNLAITSIYQINLTADDKVIKINDLEIKLKVVDKVLYINGERIPTVKAESAFITQQFIIFTYKEDCGEKIIYAVDKYGSKIEFTHIDYKLSDFRMLDGECVAAAPIECNCKDNGDFSCVPVNVSFTYDGKQLIIKKI